jgi:hypothetical protein
MMRKIALIFSILENSEGKSSPPEDHSDAAIALRSKLKMEYRYFYAATRGNCGSIVVEGFERFGSFQISC